jgi:hypothetical protein
LRENLVGAFFQGAFARLASSKRLKFKFVFGNT